MSFVNQWKAMHRRRGVSSYFRLSSSPKMMPLDVLPKERVLTSAYSSSGFELPQHIRFRNERALLEYVQKQTKIINETEEEVAKKQPFVSEPQINLPSIDMNRLVDQIYELIERKARIERERRGL